MDIAKLIAVTLKNVSIKCVDIDYTFNSSGIGSSFAITAMILLGPVELDLIFRHSQPQCNSMLR